MITETEVTKSKYPPPTFPDSDGLLEIVSNAIVNFRGQGSELESAIGMLFLGHAFGWKVIYIVHTMATVRKYEGILGIVAKDIFPEETELSARNAGFTISKKVTNFWKAVKGEDTPEGFRDRSIA